MRIHTALVFILTTSAVAGCTTTRTYDLSDPSDREAVTQKKSVQIELIDGTEIVGYDLRVDGDTLFFARQFADWQEAVALSEVASVSTEVSDPGTILLIAIPVAVVVAVVAVIASCDPNECTICGCG